jgi:uncharacterized protein (DUF608 family)
VTTFSYNETCLANQLMGQWCCRIAGLDPLFAADECASVYRSIEKLNAAPTKFGLINGGNFQGDPTTAGDPNGNHGTMIFVGENLCAAMTGMYENHPAAEGWAKTLVQTIHEHEATCFTNGRVRQIRKRHGAAPFDRGERLPRNR